MTLRLDWNWKEELANSITHGIGCGFSIAGLVFLILNSMRDESHGILALISVIIFGSSMILLYLCSTLHHSLPFEKTKRLFTILDHSAIYVFIAGTYTPFLLITLQGLLGWTLFAIIWVIAGAGIVFKSIFADRFIVLATLGYLVMGWLIVFAWGPLTANLAPTAMNITLAGGLCYSIGTIFFGWEKIPGLKKLKFPFVHAVWHLFVLAGSAFMFFSILWFV
ncbi:MAG: hemolysin III family protein [Defluviitaleaceae bacterium]|nr:hemolysin III family protein [Defluviitaleaceae bacterium]